MNSIARHRIMVITIISAAFKSCRMNKYHTFIGVIFMLVKSTARRRSSFFHGSGYPNQQFKRTDINPAHTKGPADRAWNAIAQRLLFIYLLLNVACEKRLTSNPG